MSAFTTKLQMPFLAAAQAQKHVTVNEALLRLDALVQAVALSRAVAAEPASPADGDLYILPSGKTGAAWGPMAAGALAYFRDGVWEPIAPRAGWIVFVADEARLRQYSGTAWLPVGAGVPNGGGAGQVLAKASATDQDVAWASLAPPPGLIAPYAGSSAPSGWLLCYGQAVSRTTYAALFAAIGTAYGAGDGSTTFALPDLRGRAAFGKDNMGGTAANRVTSAISAIAGTTLGAAGGDERLHQHSHGVTDPGHSHTVTIGGGSPAFPASYLASQATPQGNLSTSSTTTGVTIQNAGAGAAQNMPPALVLNYIICAGA